MRPIITSLLLTILSLPSYSSAQSWVKIDSVFSPFGVTSQGFSDPDYCDLDGDGDLDLIVASLSANRIEYFVNKGTTAAPLFRRDTNMFSSIYANGYQFTNSDYVATLDIDHDNDFDLVIGGFNGMHLYWNGGDNTEAVWFRDTVFFAAVNAVIGTDSKPAFADLDGDGDDDLVIGIGESLFEGPIPGVTIAYRNTGTPASAAYTADNSLVTGIPDIGLNAYPTLKDLDNDGDFDMVMGRDLQSMIYYKNTGTKNAPVWTNTGGVVSVVEAVTYWKIPTFADIDGDGDFDLTYGTSDGTIKHYRNIGSKTALSFQAAADYFQMIRIDGGAGSVSLGDYDKDGDLDFISGDWLGGIQYFRNDGDAAHPNFKKATTAFTSLKASSYSVPRFVDIDKDGDLDIVCGELNGTVLLWINNNGTFAQNTSMFAGIDAGYRSAPTFIDIDDDGDLDMLLGAEASGNLKFYKNNGSNVFTVESGFLTGVTSAYAASPAFVDLDRDGDYDLAIGSGFGESLFYENTGTKSAPQWKRNDAVLAAVEVPQGAAPGFADFDGDNKPDLIIGEYSGNFSFFKNTTITAVEQLSTASPNGFSLEQNYPNPFNPTTVISFQISSLSQTKLVIYDAAGREVATLFNEIKAPGTYSVQWNAAPFATGTYFYTLRSGDFVETKKLVLMK